jgi:AAA+ ATPase superfamily predicted ATPase
MDNNNPFEFGVIVTGNTFTNRNKERERLKNNFLNGTNTIMISPRRWGKSSLVKQVAEELKRSNKQLVFCFVDLFNIRSEQEFYERMIASVINSTSSKLEEASQMVKNTFSHLMPKLSLNIGETDDISVGLDLKSIKKSADEAINFAERIATKKKIKIILCIDEFQNLDFFNEPLSFQKKLRANWQHHRNVTYCLYGSKRHMMISLFDKPYMPFYRFGDMMFIQKIETPAFEKYIQQNFIRTKKSITIEQCRAIIAAMKNHPYYVQQLAHLVWNSTQKKVVDENIEISINDLINQNAIFYQRETDGLSNTQIGLLKAIADEAKSLSSKEVMMEYQVGTSASVGKNKIMLEKREIIDTMQSPIAFLDPAFELWFKRNFFK